MQVPSSVSINSCFMLVYGTSLDSFEFRELDVERDLGIGFDFAPLRPICSEQAHFLFRANSYTTKQLARYTNLNTE